MGPPQFPDAASRDDVARLAAELMETNAAVAIKYEAFRAILSLYTHCPAIRMILGLDGDRNRSTSID